MRNAKNNLITRFEVITKISKEHRGQILRWISRQNFDIQNLVFEKQCKYYFKLKNEDVDKSILSVTSYMLAVKELFDFEQILKSKNKSQDLNVINKLSKLEIIKARKEKNQPKLQTLLNLHSVVESLHIEGFSTRQIEEYLLVRHKKSISHTLISKYINQYILKNYEI